MFYISSQVGLQMFGVTDTSDGVEEFYTRAQLYEIVNMGIKIKGVSSNDIKVVNAAKSIAQKSFDKFGAIVKRKIYNYDYETCENLARAGGFVRKLKPLSGTPDEYHKLTYETVYPKSIREVVKSASQYSNNLIEVDCSSAESIKTALRSNVCLVLQHSTKGTLTSFICTGGIDIVDKIYGIGFFDGIYLTKCLTDLTYDVSKIRKKSNLKKASNPNLLNVFSCSLRFREERIKDSSMKELSSPFYSVNIPRVLGIFILDNPYTLGNLIIPEFKRAKDKSQYKFNFDLYQEVLSCIEDACNYYGNSEKMNSIIQGSFKEGVTIDDLTTRFTENFDYMEYLRGKGYSFK